jgi:hypothetical protein
MVLDFVVGAKHWGHNLFTKPMIHCPNASPVHCQESIVHSQEALTIDP